MFHSSSWRLRLGVPLEGLFPPCASGGLKAASKTGVLVKHRTVSPSVQVSSQADSSTWGREIPPCDNCSWEMLLEWEPNIQYAPGCLWEGGSLGERAHSECLEGPVESQISPYLQALSQSLLPPSREAFMEAFLADGLGGSQGGSHGRFRQVGLFRPAHQTEVLSGPRLVLTLGRKWSKNRPEVVTGDNSRSPKKMLQLVLWEGRGLKGWHEPKVTWNLKPS